MKHLDEAAVARFVQGLRSSDDAKEVRRHLASCDECRQRVAEFGQKQDTKPSPTNAPSSRDEDEDSEVTAGLPARAPSITTAPRAPGASAPHKSPASTAPLERGAVLGRYFVLDPLGEGGMGMVYAAYDPELDRKVAVKLISAAASADMADGQARLLREAQAMARVKDPNVIAVYDVGTWNDRVFVAMELVDGGTLKEWVRAKKRTHKEILRAFVDAGRGLAAAHRVGLVHRDFKPENVLISKEGRVQVTDFGLARLASSSEEQTAPEAAPAQAAGLKSSTPSGEERSKLLNSPLTQMGLVMGTPQYMSPEQHLGRTPDARSDQFTFCAALFWLLYGKRPFDPMQLAGAAVQLKADDEKTRPERLNSSDAKAIGKGVIAEPPKDSKVPGSVKRAILRGLSIDPAQRFPSMEALLAQLAPNEIALQQKWMIGGGVAAVALGSVLLVVGPERSRPCKGAERRLSGVWDAARKEQIHKQFAASKTSSAEKAFELTVARLDEYARRWTDMHTESCMATRVRGEQTEQALGLRMLCLDRRLAELQALANVLETADGETVDKAYTSDVSSALSSVKSCADVESLTNLVSMPQDKAVQARIEQVRGKVNEARALWAAGKYTKGIAVAQQASAQASDVPYPPVRAEAFWVQGKLLNQMQQLQDARGVLLQSVRAADSGRADEDRAKAMVELVTTSTSEKNYGEAGRWADLAQGAVERLAGRDEIQLDLLLNMARMYLLTGAYDDTVKSYERALALLDKDKSTVDGYRRGRILDGLGAVYMRSPKLRDLPRAIQYELQSIATYEAALGKLHPQLGYPHKNVINAYVQMDDFDHAFEHAEIAYAINRVAYGDLNMKTLDVRDWRSNIYFRKKRYREALEEAQVTLEQRQKQGAPESDMPWTFLNAGKALVELDQPAQAAPLLERAFKLFDANSKGTDLEDSGDACFFLARALRELHKDPDRAAELAARAKDAYQSAKLSKKADEVSRWLDGSGSKKRVGQR